jgi:hypothetical protein
MLFRDSQTVSKWTNEFRRENPSPYINLFRMQDTVTERKKSRKQGIFPLAALGELDRTD